MVFFRKTLILFLVSVVLLAGCVFTPDEEYVSPLREPEPIVTDVEIDAEGFANPFILLKHTKFDFKIKNPPREVVAHKVLLNDTELISNRTGNLISFVIDPAFTAEGENRVKIQLFMPTQSGSLADRFNMEYFVQENQFKVLVDKKPPASVSSTVNYENGWPVLRWPAQQKRNFIYKILIESVGTNEMLPVKRDTTITNAGVNFFIDKSFVSGKTKYKVFALGPTFETEFTSNNFEDETLSFNAALGNNLVAHLTWEIKRINLEGLNVFLYSDGKSQTIPVMRQTTFLDTLLLGKNRNYDLVVKRRNYSISTLKRNAVKQQPQMRQFSSFSMHLLTDDKGIFRTTEEEISRINLSTAEVEEIFSKEQSGNFKSGFVLSKSGHYAATSYNRQFIRIFNPSNFSETQIVNLSDAFQQLFNNSISDGVLPHAISDNGLLLLRAFSNRPFDFLYDIKTNRILWTASEAFSDDFTAFDFAANGVRFAASAQFLNQLSVYDITGSDVQLVGTGPAGIPSFLPDGRLLAVNGTESFEPKAFVFDLSAPLLGRLQVIHTYNIPPEMEDTQLRMVSFDPVSLLLVNQYARLSDDYSELHLIRLSDFSTIKIFKANAEGGSHTFSGGYQFLSTGFYQKVR